MRTARAFDLQERWHRVGGQQEVDHSQAQGICHDPRVDIPPPEVAGQPLFRLGGVFIQVDPEPERPHPQALPEQARQPVALGAGQLLIVAAPVAQACPEAGERLPTARLDGHGDHLRRGRRGRGGYLPLNWRPQGPGEQDQDRGRNRRVIAQEFASLAHHRISLQVGRAVKPRGKEDDAVSRDPASR